MTQLVERRTLDRKVAASIPVRSGGRMFFSKVNFFCADSYSVSVSSPCYHSVTSKIPIILKKKQQHKTAGGRLQTNMHTHETEQGRGGLIMLPRHGIGTY